MRNNLPAALELAARGWRVFPLHSPKGDECDCNKRDCPSPAKHPRTRHGLLDATDDVDTVTRWWKTWPHANIGVATGPASGIVVIDVDPRHEGDVRLNELIASHDALPRGPACETGGGGQHYYYRHPGGHVPTRNSGIAEGVDVKADGGYVVAPPSVHITGIMYEWYEGCGPEEPLPALPDWLYEKAIARQEEGGSAPPLPEDVPRGQRNQWLTSLGGSLRRRGTPQSVIFAALSAQNAEWSDPLDTKEVAQIAASVARYEPSEAIPVLSVATRSGGPKESYVPKPFTAAELEHEVLPEIKWAVDGFLPQGLAVLAGKAKIGKSWLTLNLGAAVAAGDIALTVYPVKDGDVLVLALEDTKRRLQSRLRMMLQGERWPERLHIETRWPRLDEGGLDVLDAWLGQHPLSRLVVIDTLAKFKPRPKGKRGDIYAEDYDFGVQVQEIAHKHGVVIVLVTHLNKTVHEDWMDQIQGSAGVSGSADTLVYLARPRGTKGQREARLRLTGRDIEEQDYSVAFDGQTGSWAIVGDWEEQKVGDETKALLDAMAKIGDPVTPEDIAAALNKTKGAAYRLLYRAALNGLVTSHKGKLYTLRENGQNENGQTGVILNHMSSMSSMSTDKDIPDTPDTYDKNDIADTDDTDRANSFKNEPRPLSSFNNYRNGTKPSDPCPECGQENWLPRAAGGWLCGGCRPWLTEVSP